VGARLPENYDSDLGGDAAEIGQQAVANAKETAAAVACAVDDDLGGS
jgi:hypothetical protein